MLVIALVVIVAAFVIARLPRTVDAFGTLDECVGGWAVISLEGDWHSALPEDVRSYAPGYLPVLRWPDGLSYVAGEVRDVSGAVHFRQGDRVRVEGSVVEGRGDPPPCYATYNLTIDRLEAA